MSDINRAAVAEGTPIMPSRFTKCNKCGTSAPGLLPLIYSRIEIRTDFFVRMSDNNLMLCTHCNKLLRDQIRKLSDILALEWGPVRTVVGIEAPAAGMPDISGAVERLVSAVKDASNA